MSNEPDEVKPGQHRFTLPNSVVNLLEALTNLVNGFIGHQAAVAERSKENEGPLKEYFAKKNEVSLLELEAKKKEAEARIAKAEADKASWEYQKYNVGKPNQPNVPKHRGQATTQKPQAQPVKPVAKPVVQADNKPTAVAVAVVVPTATSPNPNEPLTGKIKGLENVKLPEVKQ